MKTPMTTHWSRGWPEQEEVHNVQEGAARRVYAHAKKWEHWVQMEASEWNVACEKWSAEQTSREWKEPARPRGP